MVSPKQILVATTSYLGEVKIIKHLKPESAHVVAGTNVFSDLAASFTDIFGERSESYQKQLASLYDEAVERIKVAAFEIGANCVLGLKVDIDEISGKGKAMFMITSIGTAAIAEIDNKITTQDDSNSKLENVSIQKLRVLKKKNKILRDAGLPNWQIDDELWDFITENQVDEVFPSLINLYKGQLNNYQTEIADNLYKRMVIYLSNFPDERRKEMIYQAVFQEDDRKIVKNLSNIIERFELLDLKRILNILINGKVEEQKKAILMLTYDKAFYNNEDLVDLQKIKELISDKFNEVGTRSTKKQLLSSKEKEIWICTCGQSNEIENSTYCTKCGNNIYGFKNDELSPDIAIKIIDQKVKLISHFIS